MSRTKITTYGVAHCKYRLSPYFKAFLRAKDGKLTFCKNPLNRATRQEMFYTMHMRY